MCLQEIDFWIFGLFDIWKEKIQIRIMES